VAGLENYYLNSAHTHGFKACVFTAPVVYTDDPVVEEESVRAPLAFWKVAVMEDSERNELHATAYHLRAADPQIAGPSQPRFIADDAAPRSRFTRRFGCCQSATAEINLNAAFSVVSL
jgi:hypothetical protein